MFVLITINDRTMIVGGTSGSVDKIEYKGKKSYKVGNKTQHVKWVSKELIGVEEQKDNTTQWMMIERVTDGTTPLTHIARQLISKNR